jgi:hypothetical protein
MSGDPMAPDSIRTIIRRVVLRLLGFGLFCAVVCSLRFLLGGLSLSLLPLKYDERYGHNGPHRGGAGNRLARAESKATGPKALAKGRWANKRDLKLLTFDCGRCSQKK